MENTHPVVSADLEVETAPEKTRLIAVSSFTLIGVFSTVVAADVLVWNQPIGLGFAIFSVVLAVIMMLSRKESLGHSGAWIWFIALFVVSALNAVHADAIGILLFFGLVFYGVGQLVHPTLVPFWLKGVEGLLSVVRFPLLMHWTFWKCSEKDPDGVGILDFWGRLGKLCQIVIPGFLLCIPFVILFMSGNAVMRSVSGEWLTAFLKGFEGAEPLTGARVFFWFVLALMAFGLLVKMPSATARIKRRDSFAMPKDMSIAVWRTRICLLMVNLLFAVFNWTDFSFLWGQKELPQSVNYSQFVHEGTWSLVMCVLLAASVLSLFFYQERKICTARGVRLLGHLWIIQNLFLVAGVILRVQLYIEAWNLSLLRIYLVSFLGLVALGFLLMSIRIQWNKSFSWLVSANVVAAFLVLLGLHAWNEHRYVAEWNVEAVQKALAYEEKIIDLRYLKRLGPAAWPSIAEVRDDPNTFGRKTASRAQVMLNDLNVKHQSEQRDWRSLQFGLRQSVNAFEAQ